MKLHEKNTPKNRRALHIALAVCVTLILFVSLYGNYAALSNSTETFKSKFNLLNPIISIVNKYDLLVGFRELRTYLNETYTSYPGYTVGIYFEYLPTGDNISVNQNSRIWPASLVKIPVAMAVMKKVEKGVWNFDNELVILDDDKDSTYGDLYREPTGTSYSIRDMLMATLGKSDNTAHYVLLRNLDPIELEDVYVKIGLDDIIEALKLSPKEEEQDNRITAKRYSTFFRALYNSTYLGPEYSQMFLGFLEAAPKENLEFGLPEGVRFIHKTGVRTDQNVWADSGIVYVPGRPYLLTVMIQKKDPGQPQSGEVENLFKTISEKVYFHVTNAQ